MLLHRLCLAALACGAKFCSELYIVLDETSVALKHKFMGGFNLSNSGT